MTRLIDAEALQREFMKQNDGKRLMLIDVAPTLEHKKGKWELINGNFYCSKCSHYAYENRRFKFCPCCGADLRGDTE